MPVLETRDQVQHEKEAGPHPTSATVPWIVTAVVVSIVLLGILLSFVVIWYTRRRQYQQAKKLNPYLTRDEFIRRRKMSVADIYREEEARRSYIIRKSLASRSSHSMRSNSSGTNSVRSSSFGGNSRRSSSIGTVQELDREMVEMDRRESTRLKDDWKRWEARVRHERSVSAEQHPAAVAAMSSNGVPILAIPSPSKHRSHGRMNIPASPPTPPPRHPGRRSSS